jgi:hypothetical protein
MANRKRIPRVDVATQTQRIVRVLSQIYNMTYKEVYKIYVKMEYQVQKTKQVLNMLSYEQ